MKGLQRPTAGKKIQIQSKKSLGEKWTALDSNRLEEEEEEEGHEQKRGGTRFLRDKVKEEPPLWLSLQRGI